MARARAHNDLVERIKLALQGHVLDGNHGAGMDFDALGKPHCHRATGPQRRAANHPARYLDVAARLQHARVHHAIDHDVATGHHLHALHHLARNVDVAIKVDVARGHVDFFEAHHRLHRHAAIDPHRLPADGGHQHAGVVAGDFSAAQACGKVPVFARLGLDHAALDAVAINACGGRSAPHQRIAGLHCLNGAAFAVVDQAVLVECGLAVHGMRHQVFKDSVCAILGMYPPGHDDMAATALLAGLRHSRLVNAKHHTGQGQGLQGLFWRSRLATHGRDDAERGRHAIGTGVNLVLGVQALRQLDTKRLLLHIAHLGRAGDGLGIEPAIAVAFLHQQLVQGGSVYGSAPLHRLRNQQNLAIGFIERNAGKVDCGHMSL